jgi:hypothetical protein
MTLILNSPTPRIDEPRLVVPKSSLFTPALTLAITAAMLTFLNLAAAVYTYRSMRDLIAIETRLGELKAFEDRVVGRLDMMNNGIQSRLENLQGDVRGQIADLQQSAPAPAPSSPDEAVESAEIEILATVPESEPLSAVVEEELYAEKTPSKSRRDAGSKPVGRTTAYERIQSQDGKVYYRKVQ